MVNSLWPLLSDVVVKSYRTLIFGAEGYAPMIMFVLGAAQLRFLLLADPSAGPGGLTAEGLLKCLSRPAVYAVRALAYLARAGRARRADVAAALGLPRGFLGTEARSLVRAGLLQSSTRPGGYVRRDVTTPRGTLDVRRL